jgi:hypothetical protein
LISEERPEEEVEGEGFDADDFAIGGISSEERATKHFFATCGGEEGCGVGASGRIVLHTSRFTQFEIQSNPS